MTRLIKLGVIALFFSLLILRISIDISLYNSIRLTNLLLPTTIILTLIYKSKITWWTAILIFLYGIYYYLFDRIKVAYSGQFEFTLPLKELVLGDKHGHGYRTENKLALLVLGLFPFVFYIAAIFVFLTKRVRTQYLTRLI